MTGDAARLRLDDRQAEALAAAGREEDVEATSRSAGHLLVGDGLLLERVLVGPADPVGGTALEASRRRGRSIAVARLLDRVEVQVGVGWRSMNSAIAWAMSPKPLRS
jgi:hypothetical protein